MVYFLLGSLGFLLGYGLEVPSLKRAPLARQVLGVVSGSLLISSPILIALRSERFWLPGWLHALGWVLLILAGLLLASSLFWELPFRSTYVGSSPPRLVQTGSYALVRHPSVLWYGLLLLALLFISRSQYLLLAFPLWFSLDIGWAFLQEKLTLRRVFLEYAHYQKVTPMLLPNGASLRACFRSLGFIGWGQHRQWR